MLYPQEVQGLLNSLERISKLNRNNLLDPGTRQQRISSEVNLWIERLHFILRTRKEG